ncbi:hypothetical protein [Algoriphagus limi]|uniref:Sporulation related domain-containing protein n=1 Tax=Algoriphagus limi TaxID=2975273 RepID=A0ABT2G6T1_9BACT|nr:hypothetical protein [Algoriphagus limi]MCS5490959.1 hypothetical protein [Algoriphagus limi]
MRKSWIFGIVILFFSCKTGQSVVSGPESFAGYQEDLTASLPNYPDYEQQLESLPTIQPEESARAIDTQLEALARVQYEKNTSEPYFNGFRVLVYSGLNRDEAFKTQEELVEAFPEISAEMQYEQPRYLLKVGRYGYKVEALKVLYEIKTVFPSARIIRDRIQRKDFTLPSQIDNAEGEN